METATSDKGKLKNIPEIVASVSESRKKMCWKQTGARLLPTANPYECEECLHYTVVQVTIEWPAVGTIPGGKQARLRYCRVPKIGVLVS